MEAKVKNHWFLFSARTLMMGRSTCKGLLWLSDSFRCDRQGDALSMTRLVSSRAELALTFACCVDSVLGTWHPSCLPEISRCGTHHPERFLEAWARLLTICPPPPHDFSPSSWAHSWHLHTLKSSTFSLSPPHTKLLEGKSCRLGHAATDLGLTILGQIEEWKTLLPIFKRLGCRKSAGVLG